MQHLVLSPVSRRGPISRVFSHILAQVRFFALRRIKPHAPPLVRVPVNSFEFQLLRPYSPGGILKALATAPGDLITPDTKYPSFRARTTGVSNPVRSPGFRASASVSAQQPAFASGVPLDIYAFHRYTENSSCLFRTLALAVSNAVPELSPEISHLTCQAAYAPFTPSKSEQRLLPTYYRGCWHVVSRSLDNGTVRTSRVLSQSFSFHSSEVYIPKDFILHAALLGQAFAHCPKFPTAASRRSLTRVFSASVADRPLRPATDRSLGKPLPYQLANQPQAPLQARLRPLTTVTI